MTASPPESVVEAPPRSGWRAYLVPLLALGAFIVAAVGIHAALAEFNYQSLRLALAGISNEQLGLAALATVASFVTLTGYDWSALKYIGKKVPYRTAAITSFCGYAVANTLGIGALTGGSVRYRLYLDRGLDGADVARITAFCVLAFGVGVNAVGAFAVVLHPHVLSEVTGIPAELLRALSSVACGFLGALLAACFFFHGRIQVGSWQLQLPDGWLALQQLAISALDMLFSGYVLYVLLPDHEIPFAAFLGIYSAATVAGILSHVPGGIGVFEAVMLLAFKGQMAPEGLGAALVLYRFIYYIIPFILAAVFLAGREFATGTGRLVSSARGVVRLGSSLAPMGVSLLTFLSGVVLLWSSATPAVPERLRDLHAIVPLYVVETSHFLAAAIGAVLLVVANGLRHKLNGAWALALGLSLVGGAAALAKGVDYEESAFLLFAAAVLWATRKQFYRRTALIDAALSTAWIYVIVGTLAAMYVVIAFSYKHIEYAHELWWEFELQSEASRALRSGLAAAMTVMLWGLWRLLRPPRVAQPAPDPAELQRAEQIIRKQDRTDALLALMGDKRLLFADQDAGFVMYGVRGASWIAMSDPVGPPAVITELAWRFRELVDGAGGRVAFYQTRPEHLSLYIDMGLTPFKLGDEAVIPLPRFSLEGAKRKSLRQSVTRAERDGLSMQVLPRAEVAAALPRLREISDSWLDAKNAREKRFSLGAFDEDYICRGDVALIKLKDELVAFATLMDTDTHIEASIDLMRHTPQAPSSTMLYLFVQLMLHYQAQGYQRFILGMAPLAGLENHPLAPLWHRFGNLIYARGERFYNFQGLHQFKDKFDPVWEPRYLVTQSGINPLLVMVDVAALIASGVTGVFAK